ncbi:MAG: hypothetical protein ABI972_08940 [Acidobacteriota bacterium]
MSCMASAGLLVLRGCGEPAVGGCSSCGKSLCMMHIGAGTCPDCMASQGQWEDNDAAREAASRNEYYDTYGGGTPGEFGAAGFFGTNQGRAMQPGTSRFADDDYDPFET